MKINVLIIALVAVIGLSSFKGEKSKNNNNSVSLLNVSGTVIDNISGETLVGVEVILEGTDKKTYSDFEGNFVFEDVKEGDYDITAKIVSYKDSKSEDIHVSTSEKDGPIMVKMEHVE
ncbi:carboxypeptidase-like regulatory domain-containing protein [Plebeiibacterium sediminum]|uniref:Carboxypeptidase-like regulatory domain-containing protein n=1 Tax=Plebeiibacterium sediminum TaxID=2992112 RepID=A0AAE3SI39_9BACT|nr:carboxypeptidase-like regulatory domain-containing protein [Plebeiobacterium sediminum]MCW3788778.1 carboxypeptidase-like regulatory domain-containing protein [Plebeiobacterium sediminum]